MNNDDHADIPPRSTVLKTPISPLCEWKAELDAPIISATVARIHDEDAVLVLTTQARTPVFYMITPQGIAGNKGACSLKDVSPREVMTSVCGLGGRVFFSSISSVYELRIEPHRTYRLVRLYNAQGIPWPLRNLSAERCDNVSVLVASFGLQEHDIGSTGLLVICLRNGIVNTTVLPVSINDTACPSLQYDPLLSLLYILVPTASSEIILFCMCFQEPATLDLIIREFEWFTQTGTEFYMTRLVVSNLVEYFPYHMENKNELGLQVKAVCMCGRSAVIAVSAVYETGQSIDMPSILVVSELLSCLSFSTLELDNLGCQASSSEHEPGSFSICSMSSSSVTPDHLCLAYSRRSRLYVHKISLTTNNNGSADDILADICELEPSVHMFCTVYEKEGSLRCVFTSVDKMRLFLCMANKQLITTHRIKVKGEPKKEQKERQKKSKIKINLA